MWHLASILGGLPFPENTNPPPHTLFSEIAVNSASPVTDPLQKLMLSVRAQVLLHAVPMGHPSVD